MKIGFLFSGQGAQYPGMGKSLYDCSAAARRIMDEAGEQIKTWCFDGTEDELRQTRVTQPCIYAVSLAAMVAYREAVAARGDAGRSFFEPAGIAGFSLGEYAALTAAGVIGNIKTGLDIVTKRGALMLEAGTDEAGNALGGMAAALGDRALVLDCVEKAREDGVLEAVNFNAPKQTVIAGDLAALARFKDVAAAARMKTLPLNVSTAFHSSMMARVADPLRQILSAAGLKAPHYTIYCNLTGRDLMADLTLDEKPGLDETAREADTTAYITDIMVRQAQSPVYWQETIENMAADGIEAVIEFGPGTTLRGLAKKIAPSLTVLHVEDEESLRKTVEALVCL